MREALQELYRCRMRLSTLAAAVAATLGGLSAHGGETPESAGDICHSTVLFEKDGLEKSDGTAVRDQANYGPGGGGLCAASDYRVTKPLTVYRLSAWSTPDHDRWWTFDLPTGSAAAYKARNVMCSIWPVDYRTTCTLRVGAVVAIGYGQSLQGCGGPSSAFQVFVAGQRAEVESQMEKGSCTVSPSLMDP